MSKISNFAIYCTSAHESNYTNLNGVERLNAVKDFYKSNDLVLPETITVTTEKRVGRLNKDERNEISLKYALAAAKGEEITEEMTSNLLALSDPEKSVKTTTSKSYAESVPFFGESVVAAKLIDALPTDKNESFHKIRKFAVPASIAVEEIPQFIEELRKIYKASQTETDSTK